MTTVADLQPDAAVRFHMSMWLDSVAETLAAFRSFRGGKMTAEEFDRWTVEQLEARLAKWEADNAKGNG